MSLKNIFAIQIMSGACFMMLSSVLLFFSPALAGQMFIVGMGNIVFGAFCRYWCF